MKSRHYQSGMILPLVAIALTVLLGFAGVAVDAGYLNYRQQAQQNATDAAAVGGAQALVRSGCPNSGIATNAADNDAGVNGFANNGNGSNTTVTVTNPPLSGPYAANSCAVDVKITTAHVATFFSRLFGYAQGMSESTEAVAAAQAQSSSSCIYLLSPTVQANFNGANVSSPGCGIAINDTANFNGSTFLAPSIGYAGATPNENGATFKLATPAPMLPVADPCMDSPGCANMTSNPPSASGCTSYNGNGYTGSLQSGCYSYLNLNGAHVTMSGNYVLSGTSNFNGATLSGTNVTIYVTNSGTAPNFNGATV
ncbi:MAG TPA: Tad domain-containing protein, partial [Candidatus Cybelea sp.]|nr:Tad domain-containing protein [Candidatus Cybelea sp.]